MLLLAHGILTSILLWDIKQKAVVHPKHLLPFAYSGEQLQ